MPGTIYIGKAGHIAVMAEFSYRGYNVAMPEIDKGDDVFVVNDTTGAMWRVQVKTARPQQQRNSARYQFRIRETAIATPQTPELHFVFVMRKDKGWRFFVIARDVLRNYTRQNPPLGTPSGDFRQIVVTLHNDNRLTGSRIDLSHHLEDWMAWAEI